MTYVTDTELEVACTNTLDPETEWMSRRFVVAATLLTPVIVTSEYCTPLPHEVATVCWNDRAIFGFEFQVVALIPLRVCWTEIVTGAAGVGAGVGDDMP
jgi:hypothetical protein